MPHIIIEHTGDVAGDLQQSDIARKLHNQVVACGLFNPDAVKTRTQSYDDILWGADALHAKFVHVTVKILAGRDLNKRQTLAQELFAIMQKGLPNIGKLSVDIVEMDKDTYQK